MPGEHAGNPVQSPNRGDDVVALLIEDADEVVQPGQQFADLGFSSGQRGPEVVDDVTDLSQSAPVTMVDSDDSVRSVDG